MVSYDLKSVIAIRLRAARKARNMSQATVAEAVSRTEEAISNIERGIALPRLDLLQAFSELFDVPLDELVRAPSKDGPESERVALEIATSVQIRQLSIDRLRLAAKLIDVLKQDS